MNLNQCRLTFDVAYTEGWTNLGGDKVAAHWRASAYLHTGGYNDHDKIFLIGANGGSASSAVGAAEDAAFKVLEALAAAVAKNLEVPK
jgi:hypothetical protein